MSRRKSRFSVGDRVVRYDRSHHSAADMSPYEVTWVKVDQSGVRYTISRGGKSLFDFPESLLKSVDDFNGRDVPYHVYELHLASGNLMYVDVGDESAWGNLQECSPGDCTDWETSVGYGNDADGHDKIIGVHDMEDGSMWSGNNAVLSWYRECVAAFADNYSD